MTRREQIIQQLLERLPELVDPMQTRGVTGDGVPLPLMPQTWTPSVRELERLLHVMRDDRASSLIRLPSGEKVSVRALWWHLSERYLRCRQTTRDVPVRRRAKGGRSVAIVERRLVVTWDRGVRAELVTRGVQVLAERWGLAHEPMLPAELLAVA